MITNGELSWCSRWSSRYISPRASASDSRTAASAFAVISGISQEFRQARGWNSAPSELSGFRAKVSALVCGSW